jgi:hypothetical protein
LFVPIEIRFLSPVGVIPHSAVQKYNFDRFTGLMLITNAQVRCS